MQNVSSSTENMFQRIEEQKWWYQTHQYATSKLEERTTMI